MPATMAKLYGIWKFLYHTVHSQNLSKCRSCDFICRLSWWHVSLALWLGIIDQPMDLSFKLWLYLGSFVPNWLFCDVYISKLLLYCLLIHMFSSRLLILFVLIGLHSRFNICTDSKVCWGSSKTNPFSIHREQSYSAFCCPRFSTYSCITSWRSSRSLHSNIYRLLRTGAGKLSQTGLNEFKYSSNYGQVAVRLPL